jgi:membrane protein implicated in regulation of membrane protease activity
MDWNAATWWWIAAGVLVAGELATGTFYLLMLALGCAAGALAAHGGQGFVVQALAVAIVGGGAVLAWHRRRRGRPAAPERNPDINLDIGERVHVEAWDPDGTARASYRGAAWSVRYVGDGLPLPGPHVIAEVRHNELALRRAA